MKRYTKDYFVNRYQDYTSLHMNVSEHLTGEEEIVIGSIDVCMTTRCNLRCKGCGSLMPMYSHPEDIDIELIIHSLERFFSVVDRIFRVNVIGGEPFLYPHMDQVIEFLNSRNEVVWVVIPTNGTAAPDNPRLYKALQKPKNHVRISHYEAFEKKSGILLSRLVEEGIDHSIKSFGKNTYLWYDFGDYALRNRSPEELAKQYDNCEVEWMSLFKGRLYPCPRAAHSIDLGLQPDEGNSISISDDNMTLDQLRNELIQFVYERSYYPSCNRCNRGTDLCPVIPVADQL